MARVTDKVIRAFLFQSYYFYFAMKPALAISLFFICLNVSFAGETSPLAVQVASPTDFQIFQRATNAGGKLMVAGTIAGKIGNDSWPDKIEVQVEGKSSFGALPDKWQPLSWDAVGGTFRGELNLPAGGWYALKIRAFHGTAEVASARVEHVGIGEIFVVAGQSNSANYGEERQKTKSGQVAAFDGTHWQLANDPEPGAGGMKGSFMPPFGDAMAEQFHVPVGIVATGVGSTSVREWLPGGTVLKRLPALTRNVITNSQGQWIVSGKIYKNFVERMKQLGTNGFRAVLWHQGESDAHQKDPSRDLTGDMYREDLEQLIRDSRGTIGWDAPWFVAKVSYHKPDDFSPEISAAQQAVCDEGLALPGADSDLLVGAMREKNGQGIHMSAAGLKAHARLWVEKVSPWLEHQLNENGTK
jgi:hypothetical protein